MSNTETNEASIKVRLVKYDINTRTDEGEKEYASVCEKAKALGYSLFDCISTSDKSPRDMPESQTIDTSHLFNNQYNTFEGFRIFDWYESINTHNRAWKSGYYLTGDIEALTTAKESQLCCGYCGKRYQKETAPRVCTSCRGNEYLTEKEFDLLVLRPVSEDRFKPSKHKVTEAERVDILKAMEGAIIIHEQKRREKLERRAHELLKETEEKCSQLRYEASVKHVLMLNGYRCDNLIYYSHRDTWCLGWNRPITESDWSEFIGIASDLSELGLLPTDKHGISFLNKLDIKRATV